MLTISRRVAVIATSLVLAGGAAVVDASTASASTDRRDDGFTLYCTPIRPGDDDAGFYCTPTDDDFRGRHGGWTYGPPQAPRTVAPTRTVAPPTTVPPPVTTRTSRTMESSTTWAPTAAPTAP